MNFVWKISWKDMKWEITLLLKRLVALTHSLQHTWLLVCTMEVDFYMAPRLKWYITSATLYVASTRTSGRMVWSIDLIDLPVGCHVMVIWSLVRRGIKIVPKSMYRCSLLTSATRYGASQWEPTLKPTMSTYIQCLISVSVSPLISVVSTIIQDPK